MSKCRTFIRNGSILLCLSLLIGCWDSVEIDDLAMVIGSGFDLVENGQSEAIVQIASPTAFPTAIGGAGSQEEPFLVLSEKGMSTYDIVNRMQNQLPRRFFLGHRAVIIFGEEYARQGIDQFLDTFLRPPGSRYTGFVLTTYGMTAKEVLSTPSMLEYIPAFSIKKMLEEGNSLATPLGEFMSTLASDEKATITGAIRVVEGETGKFFRIDHAAVYRENKLAGFLNEEQMKMLLWLRGKITGTLLATQFVPRMEKYKGTIGVLFLGGDVKKEVTIENGKPHVTLRFKAKTKIMENETMVDLSKNENLRRVEEKFAEDIKNTLKEILELAQNEWNVDIFDFAEEIHIQHPEYWKRTKEQWSELFPTVPVTFDVELTIERIGRTQAPAHLSK
jgi:spore germination protein KC